jgi:hypothetical protein
MHGRPPIGSSSITVSIQTSMKALVIGGNASTLASNGLRLSTSINATEIAVGQSLNVTLSVFNTSPAVSSIGQIYEWPFQGVPVAVTPPCYGLLPIEVVILLGNYTAQELPSVANSTLQGQCQGFLTVDHFIFQPNSDQVNITGTGPDSGENGTYGPYHLTFGFTTSGYWNLKNFSQWVNPPLLGKFGPSPPSSTPFVPGVYTVGVVDEWGHLNVLHFQVSGPD